MHMCVLLSYMSLWIIYTYSVLHNNILGQIYVTGNNKHTQVFRSSCKVPDTAIKQKNVHLLMAFYTREI